MISKIKEKISENKYKILAGVSFAAAGYLFYCYLNDDKDIKLSTFFQALQKNQLDEVVVQGQQIWFRSYTSDWYHSSLGSFPIGDLFQMLRKAEDVTFSSESESVWPVLLIPVAIPTLATLYLFKNMNSNVGENIHQLDKGTNTLEKFEHFYGGEKIKSALKETIDFIRQPHKYREMGIRLRRGMVLYGPPGTGKTMLARIIANEAQLPFIACSGSQFQEIFVGVGPKRIRNIFKSARQSKKGCIIFIDELDAVGSRTQTWQTKEQRSTINQLLCEIDGFQQNENIFVIAATNNLPAVDPALLRPGRFDLKIMVPAPDEASRAGIIKALLNRKNAPHTLKTQDIENIAYQTKNWTGAHLQNLLNESLYEAVRNKQENLSMQRVQHVLKDLEQRQRQ